MKLIVDHKDRKVFYDEEKKLYIKEFYPKMKNKFKYFLRFRKYPGINFNYVTQELNKIGVRTPKVIEYSNYKVVTLELKGKTLKEIFSMNIEDEIVKKYLKTIVKILNNNIYYRDLGPGNFMYDGENIYAIDLEGYLVGGVLTGRKKELEDRLNKGLRNDEWVDYVLKNIK